MHLAIATITLHCLPNLNTLCLNNGLCEHTEAKLQAFQYTPAMQVTATP